MEAIGQNVGFALVCAVFLGFILGFAVCACLSAAKEGDRISGMYRPAKPTGPPRGAKPEPTPDELFRAIHQDLVDIKRGTKK
jgi:hypothetical protein